MWLNRSGPKCLALGDWLLDINCEKRKLTLAAQEQGRNSIAISPLKEDLEDLGNYLRWVH